MLERAAGIKCRSGAHLEASGGMPFLVPWQLNQNKYFTENFWMGRPRKAAISFCGYSSEIVVKLKIGPK
jgi:hypothetical protein